MFLWKQLLRDSCQVKTTTCVHLPETRMVTVQVRRIYNSLDVVHCLFSRQSRRLLRLQVSMEYGLCLARNWSFARIQYTTEILYPSTCLSTQLVTRLDNLLRRSCLCIILSKTISPGLFACSMGMTFLQCCRRHGWHLSYCIMMVHGREIYALAPLSAP